MSDKLAPEELAPEDQSSRSQFLKLAGGTGAAGALAIFVAACGGDDKKKSSSPGSSGSSGSSSKKAKPDKGDLAIVNYALTLEYLEAQFYQEAIDSGQVKTKAVAEVAKTILKDEQEHVQALIATVEQLGGKPAAKPKFNFGGAFASRDAFLKTANTLEDTGVSAYNGAAPMIESKEVLAAAGSIVQVEARHAALIRLKRDKPPAPTAFDKTSTMDEVLKAVGPFVKG